MAVAVMFCSCKKADNGNVPEAPTFSKAEILYDLSQVSKDILDNFDIAITGTGFAGEDVAHVFTKAEKYSVVCTKAPAADKPIKSDYAFAIKAKDPQKTSTDEIDATFTLSVFSYTYDAAGNVSNLGWEKVVNSDFSGKLSYDRIKRELERVSFSYKFQVEFYEHPTRGWMYNITW